MLITFDECVRFVSSKNGKVRGIMHVGAHEMQELPMYSKHNINDILWFEAQEKIVAKQKAKYPNHNIYQLVASNVDKAVLEFNVTNNGESSSLLKFGTHATEHPQVHVVETITVTTSRLDTWIQKNNVDMSRYNFLNLDIQGAELLALQGFGDYIRNFDFIYAEVNEKELYIGCALLHEIDEYLSRFGFKRVLTKMLNHGWGDALYSRL